MSIPSKPNFSDVSYLVPLVEFPELGYWVPDLIPEVQRHHILAAQQAAQAASNHALRCEEFLIDPLKFFYPSKAAVLWDLAEKVRDLFIHQISVWPEEIDIKEKFSDVTEQYSEIQLAKEKFSDITEQYSEIQLAYLALRDFVLSLDALTEDDSYGEDIGEQ